MAETVSDFIVARLIEWGIGRIYGYPGDGINGVMAALRKAGDRPRFIQARHEEMAAFMALCMRSLLARSVSASRRAGRGDPSFERAQRCEDGPCAGGCLNGDTPRP